MKQLIPAWSIADSAALRRVPSVRGPLGASIAIRLGVSDKSSQAPTMYSAALLVNSLTRASLSTAAFPFPLGGLIGSFLKVSGINRPSCQVHIQTGRRFFFAIARSIPMNASVIKRPSDIKLKGKLTTDPVE